MNSESEFYMFLHIVGFWTGLLYACISD